MYYIYRIAFVKKGPYSRVGLAQTACASPPSWLGMTQGTNMYSASHSSAIPEHGRVRRSTHTRSTQTYMCTPTQQLQPTLKDDMGVQT